MAVVEMVITAHNGNWIWRIDVDGKTVEDSSADYPRLRRCLVDAKNAYLQHFNACATGYKISVA